MDSLKKCPFCGSDARITIEGDLWAECQCTGCEATIGDLSDELASEQWNTRPIEDNLTAHLAIAQDVITSDCGLIAVKDARIAELEKYCKELYELAYSDCVCSNCNDVLHKENQNLCQICAIPQVELLDQNRQLVEQMNEMAVKYDKLFAAYKRLASDTAIDLEM